MRKYEARRLVGVSALCPRQCVDNIGCLAGRTSNPYKPLSLIGQIWPLVTVKPSVSVGLCAFAFTKFVNANAHRSKLTLDLTVTSGVTRGWMARGSHSFTCHPHVYPRMEWAILHAFRKHSPDGVAWARWRTSGSAYYSSIDPERMKGWVVLVGWPYIRRFTHVSGHPSATGRAWDRESSPVKDRHSTTVQHSQQSRIEELGLISPSPTSSLFLAPKTANFGYFKYMGIQNWNAEVPLDFYK